MVSTGRLIDQYTLVVDGEKYLILGYNDHRQEALLYKLNRASTSLHQQIEAMLSRHQDVKYIASIINNGDSDSADYKLVSSLIYNSTKYRAPKAEVFKGFVFTKKDILEWADRMNEVGINYRLSTKSELPFVFERATDEMWFCTEFDRARQRI